MKYSLSSILLPILGIIFLSCSSKKDQESDSIVESAGIGIDTAASHYPIHEIFNDHPIFLMERPSIPKLYRKKK